MKNIFRMRMNDFSFEKPTDSNDIGYGNIEINESDETTHYSIVDQFGNAIAVTTTLNGTFGSKLYSNELGFFLNNEMDDFSSKPGYPNMYGLIGGEANKIEPQKRMLSSMTPTIVEKNIDVLIRDNQSRISATTSVLESVLMSEVSIICVGTPNKDNGLLNMDYVRNVARDIGLALKEKNQFRFLVGKK